MQSISSLTLLCMLTFASLLVAGEPAKQEKVDFVRVIKPMLESTCVKCHGADRWHGELRMDTKELALASVGDLGKLLVPGKPERSTLHSTTVLPDDDPLLMPPSDRDTLSKEQKDQLRLWIEQGAEWPDEVELKRIDKVFFTTIASILQTSCIKCHSTAKAEGGVQLNNKKAAFKGGKNGAVIVPYDPDSSKLYTSLVSPSVHDKDRPRLLFEDDVRSLREWIRQGAIWPEDMKSIGSD
jgi:mono/diheme cytochrome c family protein